MSPKLLAQLVAETCAYAPGVDGSPLPDLTPSDIAAACGHVHPAICAHVIRAKWCADAKASRAVLARLKGSCVAIGHSAADRLAQAVFKAWLLPPLCETCGGRAQVKTDDLLLVCPDCEGEGYRLSDPLSDRGLLMLKLLYGWESKGWQQISAALAPEPRLLDKIAEKA